MDRQENHAGEPIALIGMGCRFPGGANTPEAFWRLLRAGTDAVIPIPAWRWDAAKLYDRDRKTPGKMYVREAGFLKEEEITHFDAGFFRMAPREAASLDPQQRLLLEVSWEALENAGVAAERLEGGRTGVFAASFWDDYGAERFYLAPLRDVDAFNSIACLRNMAAGRIAHALNIHGPALHLDTACSSSLVAIHLACQALRDGECDLALAGAASVIVSPRLLIGNSRMNALATTGRCHTFAAGTDGFGRGEGCGVVVLKRYADAVRDNDPILAAIRGSAVNHGGRGLSLTTPNADAQRAVMQSAQANAGVRPDEIQYLEAHGTGTPLGDPVEMTGIERVFGPIRETPLLVGSVKTNIGHLDAAAGMSGLMKVVLAMRNGEIPANLHFDKPNPMIRWDRLPVAVPTELTPWTAERKLAGVSAFGLSGTNAHLVVEEGPRPVSPSGARERTHHLLTLSAKTEQALRDLAGRYADYLDGECAAALADICHTAAMGRSHFSHRVAVVSDSGGRLREQVRGLVEGDRPEGVIRQRAGQDRTKRRVAFLFTGQGSQYVNMGKQLYATHALFRREMDRCGELARAYLDRPLLSVVYPGSDSGGERLSETIYAQPALFAIEWALAEVWRSWGVEPDVVIGHSTGEYAAACVAGVLGIEDGMKLVCERARLIESVSGRGATAAVLANAERVRAELAAYTGAVGIAGLNGPLETLIAGENKAVDEAISILSAAGVECRRLQIPHAPHSPTMDPILDEFEKIAGQVRYRKPNCRFVSNVTGGAEDSIDAGYWRRHLREMVRFTDGMRQVEAEGCNILLEVGPQPVLQLLARQNWKGAKGAAWLSSMWSVNDDWAQLLQSAGEFYVRGQALDWARFEREAGSEARRKVALPNYPFQRERQWTETPEPVDRELDEAHPLLGRPVAVAALGEGELLFERPLSVNSPAYLTDHRAYERVLLPGSAFIEMAIALGRRNSPNDALAVENVSFQRALAFDRDKPRRVQCLASAAGPGLRWRMFSAADDASGWTLHAEGSVRPLGEAGPIDSTPLGELRRAIDEPADPAGLYDRLARVNLHYGPSFRAIKKLWRSGDRALGELQLAAGVANEADLYTIHPALLDACLQVSAVLFPDDAKQDESGEVYLPVGIDRFTWLAGAPLGERLVNVWCAAQLRTAEAGILSADLNLYGGGGEPLGKIEGLQVRKAPARTLAGGDDWLRWLYQVEWEAQELPQSEAAAPAHWLMIADRGGLVAECGRRLRSATSEVTIAPPASSEDEYRALLESIPTLTGVVYGGGLDAATAAGHCERFLHLVKALALGGAMPAVYAVTKGAAACGPQRPLDGLEQSPLWGMAKVIPLEYPDSVCVCVDLDPGDTADRAASSLVAELAAQRGRRGSWAEEQVAYRRGLRYVARLAPYAVTKSDEGSTWDVAEQGRIETMRRAPLARRKPASGEIEIDLRAAGLNFRDILTARNLYPGNPGAMGLEGAGTVAAIGEGAERFTVGDRVMAIAPGCFGRYLTVDARLAVRIPEGLSDIQAATVPSAYVTAWHCLRHLAGIEKGQRVLIHTATGGVGHAAVELARLAGAEIYATASPAKWAVLEALGVKRIYNSRSLGFARKILEDTGGRGVDVVLNTLTAPGFIDESLAALAHGGCFLEISKRDVYGADRMAAVRPDISYHLVDQAEILKQEPGLVREQLEALHGLFGAAKLAPIPSTVFAMRDIAGAFRTMEQAAHTGKIVLVQPRTRAIGFDASATYLITGGLGGLGLRVARDFVERGARRLLLVSRGAPSADAQRQLDELTRMGAAVVAARADVSDFARMAELMTAIPAEYPLKGVVHAAGLLDDGLLAGQGAERFARVMAPKVDGAWNLHRLTETLALDFFVLFSSASSLLGLAGQANYGAANAYLDALAYHRQAMGLPALAINWGVWAEVGSASQFVPRLRRMGLDAIQPEAGVAVLAAVLGEPQPQIGVIPINWDRYDASRGFLSKFRVTAPRQGWRDSPESLLPLLSGKSPSERKGLLESHIQREVASILRYASASVVPTQVGFREIGFDSLTSMELRNRLQSALERQLPAAVIFNYPTVETLALYLLGAVDGETPPAEAPAAASEPDRQPAAMRERFFRANGIQVCLCEWGPADGDIVVCVHGTRDHGASWEGVAAGLDGAGYRIAAPDLRGHGLSDHGDAARPYLLYDFVADLEETARHLGDRRFVLVGHSLGAIIATLYAAVYPRRVEKLILVEPPLSPMAQQSQSFAEQMAAHLTAAAGAPRHAPMPGVNAAAERLSQLTPSFSAETALRRAHRLTRPKGDGVEWRWDARFDAQGQVNSMFAGLDRSQFLSMLARIPASVSIVYGDSSGWISPPEKAAIQAARPEVVPVVLPGGHSVHLDAPSALARIVREIITNSKASAA